MSNYLSLASRADVRLPLEQAITPLTLAEATVAKLIGYGFGYARIGREIGITEAAVRAHVENIASKIPDSPEIKPYRKVFLWANTCRRQQPTPESTPEEIEARKRFLLVQCHARRQVKNAVENKRLVKPIVCPRCDQPTAARRMHAHHTDYTKPLDVQWLCGSCHRAEHGKRAG